MMRWITRLNEKLNYNQEMNFLFSLLALVFSIAGNLILDTNFVLSILCIIFTCLCFGIVLGYYIYNRNDDMAHGYKVRDKIRSWFR